MTDIASLAIRIDATDASKATAKLEGLTKASGGAETATEKLAAAGRSAANANAIVGASAQQAAGQIAAEAAAMRTLENAHKMATGSSKALSQAGLNLTRQFSDVGVSLAGGISPLMVLIQQGPQIADGFAVAKQQGLGFSAVIKGLTAQLLPFAPILLAITAAVGVVAGAFAIFEGAVDKQTKNATTFGDTWKAVTQVVGKAISDGPIGDGLKFLSAAFAATMRAITDGVLGGLDALVGHFGAAYQLIVKNWRQLPQVFGVIIQGAANLVIQGVEGMVNGVIGGINYLLKKAGKETIGLIDLPQIKVANAKLAAEYDKTAASISGSFRKSREGFFNDVVKQADKNFAARQKATKGAEDHAKAVKKEADAHEEAAKEIAKYIEQIEREQKIYGKTADQVKVLDAQAMALKAIGEGNAFAAAQILRYADAVQNTAGITDKAANSNVKFERTIDDIGDGFKDARTQAEKLTDAFDGISGSLFGIGRAFKTGDFSRIGSDIGGAFSGLVASLSQGPAGILNAGSAVAGAIGGRTGRAIGGGLGIAGAGIAAGGFLASGGAAAGVANGALALGASAGTAGALGGGLIAAGAVLGPVAIAAAAAYALATLLKGKPTNAGAGFDLTTGSVTGSKRTSETEEAATGAGRAILAGQELLKKAGATLTTTINGLVIGTRDQTQIYTSAGETLRTAIGDAGAATEAALGAVLKGAKFTDAALQKLVDGLVATGTGFDDISAAITNFTEQFAAAQGYSAALADQILQLTDPKAFDVKAVKDAIEVQRKGASEAAAAGYLTADQLSRINGQLSVLEGLQLDDVMKRYADATIDAANASQEAVDAAKGTLISAYDEQASALQETISKFQGFADSLAAFRRDLTAGGASGVNPFQQYSRTKAEFSRLSSLPAGSEERLTGLQGAGSAFLAASRSASGSGQAFNRDLALVRRAVEASETAAGQQVTAAQAQLDQLTSAVSQLVSLNTNTVSVAQAVFSLRDALLTAPPSADSVALLDKITALTSEVAFMRAEQAVQLRDIAKTNSTTASTLVRVTQDGDALLTAPA